MKLVIGENKSLNVLIYLVLIPMAYFGPNAELLGNIQLKVLYSKFSSFFLLNPQIFEQFFYPPSCPLFWFGRATFTRYTKPDGNFPAVSWNYKQKQFQLAGGLSNFCGTKYKKKEKFEYRTFNIFITKYAQPFHVIKDNNGIFQVFQITLTSVFY